MNQINDYRKKYEEPVPVSDNARLRYFQQEEDAEN